MASSSMHGLNSSTVSDAMPNADDASLANDSTAPQICWLFSKQQLQNTPSIQAGLSPLVERRYRRHACELIMKTANQLQLGQQTMSTGIIFFHRFFMFHSLTSFNRYVVATTCLFLAGKVEETPKKCRDMIRVVRDILQEMQEGDIFGADPRDDIVMMEKIVLQTLKFDFDVEHPHKFLAQYYKIFKGSDKQRLEKLLQMAWAFANDASLLTLPLEWEPEIVAVAMLHLAANLQKFNTREFEGKTSRVQNWWDSFVENLTTDVIDTICHAILDMYEERKLDQAVDQPQAYEIADHVGNIAENGNVHYRADSSHRNHASPAATPSPSRVPMPTPKKARIGERPRSPPRVGASGGRQPPPPPPPSTSGNTFMSGANRPPPPPATTPSSGTVLESSTFSSSSSVDGKHLHGIHTASSSSVADASHHQTASYAPNAAGFYGQTSHPYAAYGTAQPFYAANPTSAVPTPYGATSTTGVTPQMQQFGLSSALNSTNTYGIPVGGNAASIYNNVPPVSSTNAAQRHGILLGQSMAPGYTVMQQQQSQQHSAIQRR